MGNSASTAASGDFISAAIALRTEAAPEEDVDPQGSEAFWLRVIPPAAVPAPDLWSVIQPEHIREMRATNPRNLALAIVKAVGILDAVISQPTPAAYPRLINAVRLLARLLPIVFEDQGEGPAEAADSAAAQSAGEDGGQLQQQGASDAEPPLPGDQFVRRLFWENELPRVVPASALNGGDSNAPAEGEGDESYVLVWEPCPGSDATYPLGQQLTHCAMACLFLPDLTIDRGQYDLFVLKLTSARETAQARHQQQQQAHSQQYKQRQAPHAAASASNEPIIAGGAEGGYDEEGVDEDVEEDVVPDEANAVWPMLLWAGGVGFPKLSPPSSSTWSGPRIDVLRLITALCCDPLYAPPQPGGSAPSLFLRELTSSGCPFAPTAFYCLLNTVLSYDPVGYGIPYASALLGDGDEPLVTACLQALLVLLDYSPSSSSTSSSRPASARREADDASADATAAAGALVESDANKEQANNNSNAFNIYRSMLAGLTEPLDCDILYGGITRLLANVPQSDATLLPYALHQIGCYSELLVLLWKALDENPTFLGHVLTSCDVTAAVGPVCYLMWAGRHNVTRVGLVHLCTFLLLLLSGSREFGVGLNKPFAAGNSGGIFRKGASSSSAAPVAPGAGLPSDGMPLLGDGASYADVLIITLHKLVVDGSPKLESLYSCFLTIIANISPYTKGLSLVASVKLLNLLELFGSPRFLFARPGNYVYASQLVETLNNLVQYQYESNAQLVYALVRRGDLFHRLAGLSIAGWRAKQEGKAAGARSPAPPGRQLQAAAPSPQPQPGPRPQPPQAPQLKPSAVLPFRHSGGHPPVVTSSGPSSSSPAKGGSLLASVPKGRSATSSVVHASGGSGLNPASEEEVDGSEWVSRQADAGGGDDTDAAGAGVAAAVSPSGKKAGGRGIAANGDTSSHGPLSASHSPSSAGASSSASPDLRISAAASGSKASNAASSSGGAWQPTDEWLEGSVKRSLHLGTILRLIAYLTPLLERHSIETGADDDSCVDFIRASTVVGVLPQPHPIVQRVYQPNAFTSLWFSTFTWSTVYLAAARDLPLWDAGAIRMFQITVA